MENSCFGSSEDFYDMSVKNLVSLQQSNRILLLCKTCTWISVDTLCSSNKCTSVITQTFLPPPPKKKIRRKTMFTHRSRAGWSHDWIMCYVTVTASSKAKLSPRMGNTTRTPRLTKGRDEAAATFTKRRYFPAGNCSTSSNGWCHQYWLVYEESHPQARYIFTWESIAIIMFAGDLGLGLCCR